MYWVSIKIREKVHYFVVIFEHKVNKRLIHTQPKQTVRLSICDMIKGNELDVICPIWLKFENKV